MQIYLVGGAVRDELLGISVVDRDWVVVGATHSDMLSEGFKRVGADFPVYLHPETHEEYALARTERKSGKGYHGFVVYSEPSVTLEEDLFRRDLTINAIAKDKSGRYIDPDGGIGDLKARILRHVSEAFIEDPVRVLRLARFYARYHHYGFVIAPETRALVKQMCDEGELSYLVPERIWAECQKALSGVSPEQFFYCLKELGVLDIIFPELSYIIQKMGVVVLKSLKDVAIATKDPTIRFGTLCHALDVTTLENFSIRLRIPNEFKRIALKISKWYPDFSKLFNLSAENILSLILGLDAIRNPKLAEQYCCACESIYKVQRQGVMLCSDFTGLLLQSIDCLRSLDVSEAVKSLDPADIPLFIYSLRIDAINNVIKNYSRN